VARELGIKGLRVGVVFGDDIKDRLDEFDVIWNKLKNMETGEPISIVKDKILSANVYFGSMPIVEALRKKADIIITGRTTDTDLLLHQ